MPEQASPKQDQTSPKPEQTVAASPDRARQAAQAFNALALAWNVAFVPETGVAVTPASLERLARQRRLELIRFTGSLEQLVRLDAPVLLELRGTQPGSTRLVALTGYRGGRVVLAPAAAVSARLTLSELKRLWTGRAYLFWKNYQDIPVPPGKAVDPPAMIRLQLLLAVAGYYNGEPTGVFDAQTRAALREFQASAGLKAGNGINAQTLLLLYRKSVKYPVPRLGTGEGGHS